jgi:hypothetical protein
MFSMYHSGSHHAAEPAREAWIVSRPLLLISTTDLPTQVGRLSCTKSTLAIHCAHREGCRICRRAGAATCTPPSSPAI